MKKIAADKNYKLVKEAQGQSPPFKIKDKQSGDAFRNWVNDNYPDSARKLRLDRTGNFNNSFIQRAWKMHGAEYNRSNATPQRPTNTQPTTYDARRELLKINDHIEKAVAKMGDLQQKVYGKGYTNERDILNIAGKIYAIPREIMAFLNK